MDAFVVTFLHGSISFFYMVMLACFKDYDFGITEFVLSVSIAASAVDSILSLLLLILLSLQLFVLLLLLYSH